MSESFDWTEAGKSAQAANIAKHAEAKGAEQARAQAAAEEKVQTQMLLQRSWAIVGELNKACAEIATKYNVHVRDFDLRLNVLGGGIGRFTVTKGTRGAPRLEVGLEGADQIEIYHATSGRKTAGATDVYSVQPEGDLVLLKGAQVWSPAQVAETICKWLVETQAAE